MVVWLWRRLKKCWGVWLFPAVLGGRLLSDVSVSDLCYYFWSQILGSPPLLRGSSNSLSYTPARPFFKRKILITFQIKHLITDWAISRHTINPNTQQKTHNCETYLCMSSSQGLFIYFTTPCHLRCSSHTISLSLPSFELNKASPAPGAGKENKRWSHGNAQLLPRI